VALLFLDSPRLSFQITKLVAINLYHVEVVRERVELKFGEVFFLSLISDIKVEIAVHCFQKGSIIIMIKQVVGDGWLLVLEQQFLF